MPICELHDFLFGTVEAGLLKPELDEAGNVTGYSVTASGEVFVAIDAASMMYGEGNA